MHTQNETYTPPTPLIFKGIIAIEVIATLVTFFIIK
jgi:hypothetical protein